MLMFFDITSQLLSEADAWIGFLVLTRPDGTSIAFLNVMDESFRTNSAWVCLDTNEEQPLEAELANESAETFILHRVVGSVVGQRTIAQEAS